MKNCFSKALSLLLSLALLLSAAAFSASADSEWKFSAFGTGVDTKKNGYEENAGDNSVRIFSLGGKGKLVAASTDGLAFYYTKIDPAAENFRLSATACVNAWTFSNGQEGFGLMAADAVGENGDKNTFWNNSYMACVTRLEYTAEKGKYSMKLGVGSQEKIGVTPDNIDSSLMLIDKNAFSSTIRPLDTSCASLDPGTYNLVGAYTNESAPDGTVEKPRTEFKLAIEKNNTGYFVSYTDPDGVTHTEKYYEPEALNQIDKDNVYVGFFASRNADITFRDIVFTTSDPKTDPPAEERPVTIIETKALVVSAEYASSENYTFAYFGNADGQLVVKDSVGNEIYNDAVKANEKVSAPASLRLGDNTFIAELTPDADYRPGKYEKLSSYEKITLGHTVRYEFNSAEVIYVSPDGKADASGTKAEPQSLSAAVRKAIPGQKIIILEGDYKLTAPVVIERGINGAADAPIELIADPESDIRPVLDFGGNCAGLTLAGDHWHLKGFDVTGSANGQIGVRVSGSHNVLEDLETYKNGNTGIQITRYKSTDAKAEWPSDNLVLNCTSYLNADKGYEDADGFAAKITVGEGNVFDGCVAHHNADDGWDLYAKLESGQIGKVVIKNSVAYKNGYVFDENGAEKSAGNGNGFKMGGENISGHHVLINSVAFANKAKGIDSNSCPDIEVYNSTSYDNGSYNVALYTNTAADTAFVADGIISFKKSNDVGESFKPKGSQDSAKIYGENNYYFGIGNSVGVKAEEEWFKSLDTEAAVNGGITRFFDGSVNMNGYLELTDKAPKSAGARLPSPYPSDIPEGEWYEESVKFVVEKGVFKGNNGLFMPEMTMTRAAAAQILWNMEGRPASDFEMDYSDVYEGAWYADAVRWAAENGLVSGCGDGRFGPEDGITREQLATVLYRCAQMKGRGFKGMWMFRLDYDDAAEISDWAGEAMHWMVMNGVIKGQTEKTLAPKNFVTRAEAAAMAERFLSAISAR